MLNYMFKVRIHHRFFRLLNFALFPSRYERLDSGHVQAVDVDPGPEFSFIGKKQSSAGNEEDPTVARVRSFVTIAPNNSEVRFRVNANFKPSVSTF